MADDASPLVIHQEPTAAHMTLAFELMPLQLKLTDFDNGLFLINIINRARSPALKFISTRNFRVLSWPTASY